MRPLDVPRPGLLSMFALAAALAGAARMSMGAPLPVTEMLGDIRPGTASSVPVGMVRVGGQVCFGADDGVLGRELWCSNGTPEGTQLVADIHPGVIGSDPQHMVVLGDQMLFTAGRPGAGRSLWRSDGTAAGTAPVFEFPSGSGDPGPKVVMDGVAYFAATGVSTGRELWRSDGTGAGTWRVRDINPGIGSSEPDHLAAFGSILYFRAGNGVHGHEPWRSDGTHDGTWMLRDLSPGSGSSWPLNFVALGQRLFFLAEDPVDSRQIWRSDGDAASTVKATSIGGLAPLSLAPLGNNSLLFSGITGGQGRELHRLVNLQLSAIVSQVADINPGAWGSDPSGFVVRQGVAHFAAGSASHGRELWRSDGTPAGTWLVADLQPGTGDGSPACLFWFRDRLYFHSFTARTLWQSDGTTQGTRQLDSPARRACAFAGLDARLLFRAERYDIQSGQEPWVLFDDAIFAQGFQ